MPENDLVVVDNLRKTYGATVAVDGVSLTVRIGEILGILGPNGAGKTTTVESIAGPRTPDGGRWARRYDEHAGRLVRPLARCRSSDRPGRRDRRMHRTRREVLPLGVVAHRHLMSVGPWVMHRGCV
jgi:ABC-type glutathione transport system ATPase component